MLPLCLPKLKVNLFGITGSLLAINLIAFLGETPCYLLDYMSGVEEYVIELKVVLKWFSIMCLSTLVKVNHSNSS
jgi:hypothetical protein